MALFNSDREKINGSLVKIAAAQIAPHFLDREKTVELACEVISQAGKNVARLIVFPEAFISGYPDWVWVIPNGNANMLDKEIDMGLIIKSKRMFDVAGHYARPDVFKYEICKG